MACFGLLNISRLFKQLCQYQAHAVNHQPTKCRTADFYNRQNGTSWESDTFPIKFFPVSLYEYVLNRQLHVWEKPSTNKKKKPNKKRKNMFSGALFWRMGKPRTLVTLSTMLFFVIGFSVLALLCFMHFFLVTHVILYSNLIFWKRNAGVKGFLESLST